MQKLGGRRSKDEETWRTTLWTGCDVDDDEEGNMRMVNGEAGDLEPDIKPPVVEGFRVQETGEGMTVEGDKVEVTELKGTLLRSIGAKRDNEDWDKEEEGTKRGRRSESDWEEEERGEMKMECPVRIERDCKEGIREDFAKSGPWRFDLPPDVLRKETACRWMDQWSWW